MGRKKFGAKGKDTEPENIYIKEKKTGGPEVRRDKKDLTLRRVKEKCWVLR